MNFIALACSATSAVNSPLHFCKSTISASLVFEYVLIIFFQFSLVVCYDDDLLNIFNERSPLDVVDAELLVCDHI